MSILSSLLNYGNGAVDSVNGKTGVVVLDKNDIGLNNVDNTSDVNKPVSTAQTVAIQNVENQIFLPQTPFYFYQESSDISPYYKMLLNPSSGSETLFGFSGVTSDQLLVSFVNNISLTPTTTFGGAVSVFLNLSQTDGEQSAQIYAKLYKRSSAGSETLIGTTGLTDPLTINPTNLSVDFVVGRTTFLSTDRLVVKLYSYVSGFGTAPEIQIFLEGSTNSRVVLPFAMNYYLECTNSTSQTVVSGTFVSADFDTELTNIAFGERALTTRFQPTVAGLCLVSYRSTIRSNQNGTRQALLIKNGSSSERFAHSSSPASITDDSPLSGSAAIYFNGTTDYVELIFFQVSGITLQSGGTPTSTTRNHITLKYLGN